MTSLSRSGVNAPRTDNIQYLCQVQCINPFRPIEFSGHTSHDGPLYILRDNSL